MLLALASALAPQPAGAVGRCDVAPLGAPDGAVNGGDVVVILRVALGLVDPAEVPFERADVAPVEVDDDGVARSSPDGRINPGDAVVCLRGFLGLIVFPANLVVSIEAITPSRPPVGGSGTATIRLENDGDASVPPGATLSLRLGGPFPGAPDAISEIEVSLAPGASHVSEVEFPAGSTAGATRLHALAATGVAESSTGDNSASLAVDVNGPPTAGAGSDLEGVREQTAVELVGSFTDPNEDEQVTYEWRQESGAPVSLDGADTASPSFTAPDIQVETELVFSLRVTDAGGLRSPAALVRVSLVPENDAPSVSAQAMPDSAPEAARVTLCGQASDVNEDPLEILWVQTGQPGEPPVALESPSELCTDFAVPDLSEEHDLHFEFRATDDEGAAATGQVAVHVFPLNREPVAVPSALPPVPETSVVQLDGSGSFDPDGDPLRFEWTQAPVDDEPRVFLFGADASIAEFVAPEAESPVALHFQLRVVDPDGVEDVAELVVDVRPDPRHPAAVVVRPTPGAVPVGATPAVTVEVEVLARDASQLVRDGTLVAVTTTLGGLGGSSAQVGTTRLGLFTVPFTPGPDPGEALLRVAVMSSSATGEARVLVGNAPSAVGTLSLSLDRPTIAAGSPDPVLAVATVLPVDERVGAVADGTELLFSASGGGFPLGEVVPTSAGVAVAELVPPSEPGPVSVRVRAGDREAEATLVVVSDPAEPRLRLHVDRPVIAAGGAETLVTAFLEPAVPGTPVAPLPVSFAVDRGLVDGEGALAVQSEPAPPEVDVAPYGDFPGPGDLDSDGDGVLDVPGAQRVQVAFSHPDPVSEPRTAELTVALPDGAATAAIRIGVVPTGSDPAELVLDGEPPVLIAGAAPETGGVALSATVAAADGGPVADATPVGFAASRGDVVPGESLTLGGVATAQVSHPEPFPLTARIRARGSAGGVAGLLDLVLAPRSDAAAALELVLTPTSVATDGEDGTEVVARVRRADGSAAADGTRVVFHASGAVPSAAFAATEAGEAAIRLGSSALPGPFTVHARVAGTVASASARGAFAPPHAAGVTLDLRRETGAPEPPERSVGSIEFELVLPADVLADSQGGVARSELIHPPEGVASNGATALAADLGDTIRVVLIDPFGISGSGPLVRLFVALPPAAELPCDSLAVVSVDGTDIDGLPLDDVAVECSNVEPE